MKTARNAILILSIAAVTSACKLAVIVVEGGEVNALNSGTRCEGAICIVEVNDTGFSEIFFADEKEGWYFKEWNKGHGFFCGGSNYPVCSVSFEGYEGTEEAQAVVESPETFYLMPVFKKRGVCPTPSGGKEWLQPADFIGYSREEIAAVCSPSSGICSGSLSQSSFDLNGYTWASESEIGSLYCEYRAAPPYDVINGGYPFSTGSPVNDSGFFDDFAPTDGRSAPEGGRILTGLLREKDSLGKVDGYFGEHYFGLVNETVSASENIGVWFWRPVD